MQRDSDVQFVTIHGHRRAYVKKGSGPAVLLLHGMACDHTTWLPIIDKLAERHTVIAPDLLGHGLSDKPRADYSVGGYANAMRDLLTVLGINRVTVVGHSLGGMLARGVAARRPDLVAGIVTMGSPMLAPGAHHVSLARSVDLLVRLNRAGMRGLMAEDCVAGSCAQESFDQARAPLPEGVDFTAIFSRRDGIVDWRACVDPVARPVEVRSSHVGMAFDPVVITAVSAALRPPATASVVEVDRGEIA